MEEPSSGKSIEEIVKPIDECTRSGYQTFAVIQESEDYYIVKNAKGEPLAIDKDKCRVEVIGASMIK